MDYFTIEAKPRVATGKIANKVLRKTGEVPVVLYDKLGNNIMCSIPLMVARKLVADYSFMTRVFNIKISNQTHLCVARDVQFNPITDVPDHFDFKIADPKEKIVVSVPTVVVGKENSVGLKRGGNVSVTSYNVKLSTTVESIPNCIEVDISDSVIGSKYYLSDLKIGAAEPLYDCLVVKVSGRQAKEDPAVGTEVVATANKPA